MKSLYKVRDLNPKLLAMAHSLKLDKRHILVDGAEKTEEYVSKREQNEKLMVESLKVILMIPWVAVGPRFLSGADLQLRVRREVRPPG